MRKKTQPYHFAELPQVRDVRPMDLTHAEKTALIAAGYKLPLSARIGRGELFVVVSSFIN